jgi:hypothetical protein
MSADPAMGEYIPVAPISDEARRRNGSLPGMGGVFNLVNLHVYHYAGNNPVKYIDPDGRTPGDPFDTKDEAAKDALDYCNPKAIDENFEYGGVIYLNSEDGKYYATEPRTDKRHDNVYVGNQPVGTERVGDYHSHGDYTYYDAETNTFHRTSDPNNDNMGSDTYSVDDIKNAVMYARIYPGHESYLGTPSGAYYKLNPFGRTDEEKLMKIKEPKK